VIRSLKDRWFTDEGRKLSAAIMKCFSLGSQFKDSLGLDKHNGRWDLRGITLPIPFKATQAILKSVDLSHATLYESHWERCSFNDVVFFGSKLDRTKFWACQFDDVIFEKAFLNEVVMNATLSNESGHFKNVSFIESNLKGTIYGNTLFKGCRFINCPMHLVDFNGSRFVESKFSGNVVEVFFRGQQLIDRQLYPYAKPLPNLMDNVDFSEAVLESVVFLDSIDLSRCIFPSTDDYIVIRENRNLIFDEVRKEIDSSWEGVNKKIGLALIDQAYLSPRQRNNRGEVIDRHFLLKTEKEFGVKFFELVKKFNESLNDTGGSA
jgi:uncharacterized protein YjbI with pentapeptide repeats